MGQWEGAWAVSQLHYDQFLKQEAGTGKRLNKGHPACNLAILARDLGAPFLARHFALLSSAGDIYWEHKNPDLKAGGFAPTLLEQSESNERQEKWRKQIREDFKCNEQQKPLYLEAFVTARWFASRGTHIRELAKVIGTSGKPFTEVLLDAIETPPPNTHETATGTRFEAAVGLLLASTPGFGRISQPRCKPRIL